MTKGKGILVYGPWNRKGILLRIYNTKVNRSVEAKVPRDEHKLKHKAFRILFAAVHP